MKKSIFVLMLIICFVFSGCSQEKIVYVTQEPITEETKEPVQEDMITPEPTKDVLENLEWTSDDTEDMSNYMNHGKIRYEGSWIYSSGFDSDGSRHLYKLKEDGSEKTKLSDTIGKYITLNNGWIYCIAYNSASKKFDSIMKMRMSGSSEKKIVKLKKGYDEINYMFIHDDKIYYTMQKKLKSGSYDNKLYCCTLSGKKTKVVLNKAVYYPYIIGDYIYYQDDANYSKLTRCDLQGNNEEVICEDVVYSYIFDGKMIYYTSYNKTPKFDKQNHPKDKKLKWYIYRIDVNGENKKTIVKTNVANIALNDDKIFFVNRSDGNRIYSCQKDGKAMENLSQKNNIFYYLNISGDNLFFEQSDNKWEYTVAIYNSNLDGTNINTLFE